jgi:ribosomal protein S12 methylthiotransferase
MRGRLASRPLDEVMAEAERLVAAGVRELLVISQDTSAYGADLRYRTAFWQGRPLKSNFEGLCRALGALGVWVRLHYVYPYPHVDDVLPLMAEGKVLPYLDIPFQHGSPRLLKQMRRPAAAENTLARIHAWRKICPELTLRSTFIVGFPGETDREFDELLAFIDEAELDRVGCFEYSAVEGAAANELPGAVSAEVKAERYARFMERQQAISRRRLAAKVGSEQEILIDRREGSFAIGRSRGDAPDIDGLVYLRTRRQFAPGTLVRARIERADDYDLYGVPA